MKFLFTRFYTHQSRYNQVQRLLHQIRVVGQLARADLQQLGGGVRQHHQRGPDGVLVVRADQLTVGGDQIENCAL